jgi:very-short-patch-repair endonuclease/transcription elongation GreA/GreB family factor
VSPFVLDTFEPALRACQTRIDPEGRYLPDHEKLSADKPVPAANAELVVSDRWVIFVRRRSDNFLLSDLAKLTKSIDAAGGDLPEPAKTLVMGPASQATSLWKPLHSALGETTATEGGTAAESPLGVLFFPKPSNNEQAEIVARLERADGVVVQGPPGTGKTHTISNIICHYMATGRRVLVVSHGEPALAVLRQQLPEEVRDLAISITTSEREGVKQVETAVRLLQSIVESLRPSEQTRLIADIERSIIDMRRRVALVDSNIERIAEAHLTEVPEIGRRPADLAKLVQEKRQSFAWFNDRPADFASALDIGDQGIAELRAARIKLADRIEHINARFPSINDLPEGHTIARLHENLIEAEEYSKIATQDRSLAVRISSIESLRHAEQALDALDALLGVRELIKKYGWVRHVAAHDAGDTSPSALRSLIEDASAVVEEQARYLRQPVTLPEQVSAEAYAIVARLAEGEQVFGIFAFKEKRYRAVVESIQVVGRAPASALEWAHVRDHLRWRDKVFVIHRQWETFAVQSGAPQIDLREIGALQLEPRSTIALSSLVNILRRVVISVPTAIRQLDNCLPKIAPAAPSASSLWSQPERLAFAHDIVRSAIAAARLSAAKSETKVLAERFLESGGKLARLARDVLTTVVGRHDIESDKIASAWDRIRSSIDDLAQRRHEFHTVREAAERIRASGAPEWAARILGDKANVNSDPVVPLDWREAWDWAAAQAYLQRIDQRDDLRRLGDERVELDNAIAKTFERLVRERTFYALGSSMTGPVRAALMMFVTALRKIGKGTGKGAGRHRRDARTAMSQCYGAIPCWIMPSWRVAEQLPSELGSFDLVIMDEASQSDIKEITALLRGKKILVVGDDKQVSPTAAFIEDAKIERLARGFLMNQPFKTILLPGASLYDLAKVMFPDKFVMLREHFRCVEPIIRFSMQFYPEPLLPLRIPTAQERIDPPLVDIYVPDGRRTGDKINSREAEVIVQEVRRLVEDHALAKIDGINRCRTIGAISLIGAKQAALINRLLLEELGEEVMLRHRIACGDSATFQGNERDIIFLSMVADSQSKQTQTAAHFEQRFNVALSRARDRMILVRSVREEELNPIDLRARVVKHFREPMAGVTSPSGDLMAMCESNFEREVLKRLLAKGYRVRPQVGALGYRIDLVVEGGGARRLAVECDGDKYHGPERWADDMQRQRVLERVGWRFWRCWASSFTLDPDGCLADLFATLARLQIHPIGASDVANVYVEHKTAGTATERRMDPGGTALQNSSTDTGKGDVTAGEIRPGDRVVIRYLDDNKVATFTLSRERHDPTNGILSVTSPLGSRLVGLAEEDEADFEVDGRSRRVLIVRAERQGATMH